MVQTIIPLNHKLSNNPSLVGGKVRNLYKIFNTGIKIPKSIVLTSKFFNSFKELNGIINPTEQKELILQGIFNDEMKNLLTNTLNNVGINLNLPLVCRSSAINEDGMKHSYAGQYESMIGFVGLENLLTAIKLCWYNCLNSDSYASYFNIEPNYDFPLLIQELVDSKVSGVCFTDFQNNKIIIESAWGQGISVVNNFVTPDKYIVDITSEQIEFNNSEIGIAFFNCSQLDNYDLGDYIQIKNLKEGEILNCKLIYKDHFGEIGLFQLPIDLINEPTLNNTDVLAIMKLAKKLVEIEGKDVDFEWSINFKKELFLLQIRPVTAKLNFNKQNRNPLQLEKNVINGVATSEGIATGRVKVVNNANDFIKVEEGDILVCKYTDPTYINVMVKAAGIITEDGGLLSHTSIVAREMGKPCITNVENALNIFQDNDIVQLNGTHGFVKFLDDDVIKIIDTEIKSIYKNIYGLEDKDKYYEEIYFNPILILIDYIKNFDVNDIKNLDFAKYEDFLISESNSINKNTKKILQIYNRNKESVFKELLVYLSESKRVRDAFDEVKIS